MRIELPALNRPVPKLGPEFYKTYSLRAPLGTHWRQATCEEYECDKFLNGFVLTVDLSTDLGQRQAHFARHDRTRSCHEQRISLNIVKFVYGPGNDCFSPEREEHRVPVGRLPLYIVSQGDWRGNPRGIPVYFHRQPEFWVEDFALHQQAIADAVRKG